MPVLPGARDFVVGAVLEEDSCCVQLTASFEEDAAALGVGRALLRQRWQVAGPAGVAPRVRLRLGGWSLATGAWPKLLLERAGSLPRHFGPLSGSVAAAVRDAIARSSSP